MCHFYKWTAEYARSLDGEEFKMFHECIPILKSRDILHAINVASYTELTKKSDREKMFNRYHKAAWPVLEEHKANQETVTTDNLARILAGLSNGK